MTGRSRSAWRNDDYGDGYHLRGVRGAGDSFPLLPLMTGPIARVRRIVKAHRQKVTLRYSVNIPDHVDRDDDPWACDFREYKRRRKANGTNWCDFAKRYRDDFSECSKGPLEAHHSVLEFALANGVDIDTLERDFPGVSKQEIGQWINTDQNLELLCEWHHRGAGGKHTLSHAHWSAFRYYPGLVVRDDPQASNPSA